jgi:hypothetical protein
MDNAVYTKEGRIDTFCLEADEVQWMNGGRRGIGQRWWIGVGRWTDVLDQDQLKLGGRYLLCLPP